MANPSLIPCDFKTQGPCFARCKGSDGRPYCRILNERITSGFCSFCKEDRSVTNGIKYGYNPKYGKEIEEDAGQFESH